MLRYAILGPRTYGEQPMEPHTRSSWEFQAVLDGRLGLWLPGRTVWRERTLWLFPPACSHGWRGRAGAACRVAVLHVAAVGDLLQVLAREDGYLEVALDDPARQRVEQLAAAAAGLEPGAPLSGVRGDAIAAELALLLAERLPAARLERYRPTPGAAQQVAAAVAWYAANLDLQPGVAAVAQALGVSEPHLRRLFQRVRGCSPRTVFAQMRIQRAEQRIGDRSLTLDEVARSAGFADATTLSRSFRRARGLPPGRAAGRRRTPGAVGPSPER
jgi:AraC-like DNA-binding protein